MTDVETDKHNIDRFRLILAMVSDFGDEQRLSHLFCRWIFTVGLGDAFKAFIINPVYQTRKWLESRWHLGALDDVWTRHLLIVTEPQWMGYVSPQPLQKKILLLLEPVLKSE